MTTRTPGFPYLASTRGPGFLNAPPALAGARFTVAGVAWDGATTNRPGARLAPHAIRRASQMMCDAVHPLWDATPQPPVQDIGDLPLPNTSIERMRAALIEQARPLVAAEQLAPWLARARRHLEGDAPLYLTLDIDALDPAYAPGTGTPEPAGLTSRQLATWLEELADLPFVGMDLVEVAPPFDHAELTSQVAAMLVWTYLCGRLTQ